MFQNIDCGYSNRQFKEQVTPSVQLHFDGTNHWTMSFSSYKDENCVYYIDSLGANLKDLRNNVKIQLSQIYRTSSTYAYAKTNVQISFAVTAKLISAFVFATWIVESLYFKNL